MDKIKKGLYSYKIGEVKIGEVCCPAVFLTFPPVSGEPVGTLTYSKPFEFYGFSGEWEIIDREIKL
jgi:hypothetical protein